MGRLGETKETIDIEAETSTVGLYDVCTVARIAPLLNEVPVDKASPEWKLKPKSNERFLVLASCSDLAVFTLGEKTDYSFNTGLEGTITDFEILGSSAFLVGIIEKRRIVILSLEKQELYFNEPAPHDIDFVFCNPTPTVCYLTFGSRTGDWHTVMMQGDVAASKENNRVENWQRDQIQEYFQQAIQKTTTKTMRMEDVSGDITSISTGPLQSFASIHKQQGLSWCGLAESQFSVIGREKQFVRVRDGGRFSLHLDTDGWIHVFDPLTFSFWHEFDVKMTPDDVILDFVVIDKNETEVPKLFAIITSSGGEGSEMVIYDRTKHENCFSLPSAISTTLFAYGGSDRVLMAVEELDNCAEGSMEKSRIVVRQVSQSRPEMRFESLLKNNRFDEAEKFAKTFKLDVQKVYKAHVTYLMDTCDEEEESFAKLMETMVKIEDHNMVAETYFTLVGMSRRCDRIRTYLTHAKKRRISDMDVLKMIESLCYTWATYRIIVGPVGNEVSSQIREDIWDLFVEALHDGNPWIEMYNEFILSAQFTQARVIFSRHGQMIIDHLCADDDEAASRLDALFRMFIDAISADIKNWSNVIEHVTMDILPACLSIAEKLVPCLENLITTLIPLLEYRDSTNWPDNAIKAASSYDTMTKLLVSNGNTPVSQSLLLYGGSKLSSSSLGGSSSMSRVKKMYYDLIELKRLKEVFECSISFSVFQTLPSEGICHKILQNALTNPNTTHAKIEKFVVPFMEERHLDQEQTIVNYIQMMSGAAVSKANAFGWEKQCVQLCASLKDESRRCCSIISIASTAKLPWPVELNEAVDKILASRTLLRSEIEEMEMVCKRTDLYKMLSSYGYSRHDIELLTLVDSSMDIIMTIRCMLAQREKPSRFVDVIKLIELLKAMLNHRETRSVKIEYVQSFAVIHMMYHEDVTTSIINYIDSLGERERVKTISLIFSFIERVADTPASGVNILEREKMLGVGEGLLSYYVCRDNDYNDPERRLKDNLVLLREVQKNEAKAVLLSDFQDEHWRGQFLEKLLESESSLRVKLNNCSYMGIPIENLIEMLLRKAFEDNDIDQIVDSITNYTEFITPWTETTRDMLDPIVQTLSWITFRLPELLPTETEVVRADYIAFTIKRLGRVVRETIRRFPFDVISDDLHFLLQLEAFFNLGEHIINQSLRGQENENESQDAFRSEDPSFLPATASISSTDNYTTSKLRIFDFKRPLGTYDFSCEPALFEGVQGVINLAMVAPSVARPYGSDITNEDANEFRANWDQLNMFLAMHSQDLLDISARVFAGSLECWSKEYLQGIAEMEMPVLNVVERMLQQKKFDFWHAVTLLGGIPLERLDRAVTELQRRPGVRSSTKATIQYLQLAFVMSLLIRNSEKMPIIISGYEQKYLVKKLAEEGIRASINGDFVEKVIQQAVELRQPLPPLRLHDYVKKYVEKLSRNNKMKVGEYMVRYATLLIRKASAAGRLTDNEARRDEIAKFIELARLALRLAVEEEATCICNYLHCLLYIVCPYNYEVLQFIVTSFGQYATEESEFEMEKNLKSIMSFLWSYRRTNHISSAESIWFTKRESTLLKGEKEYEKSGKSLEPFGHSLRLAHEDDGNNMSDMSGSEASDQADAMVYERNSVIISDMPALAMQHLPFHGFLLRKKEEVTHVVLGIVNGELSIFNVPIWQAFLREVQWLALHLSRSQLLSSAIFTHANKYAKFGKSLPEGERNTIHHLLDSASNRAVVVTTIALLFKNIILSDVKIELLQMGVDISSRWTQDLDGDEQEEMQEQSDRLKDGIAKFFTELELKKNGIYNEKTADNIENVQELCTLIYDEMIQWDNSTDVAKKCEVVERIAKANGLDLVSLHEKLVFAWVEDQESSIPISHVDMNESIGGTSFTDQKDDSDDQNELRIPLFDTVLDKIVILCKKLDKKRLLTRLGNIIMRGGRKATGGFTAVVRAVCIILRSFTDTDVNEFSPGADLGNLCAILEIQLNERLFDKAEMKYDEKTDKIQLIKTLLQCPSRTQTMTALIACLIIDHDFNDPKSIDQVMARLQITKQWNTLRALLNYVRSNKMDSMIRSFPLLWFRVYENAIFELNGKTTVNPNWNHEQCVMLRMWTLWAMSSNVEGGRLPNIARFLRELNCPVSASIMSVLSSWTVDKMDAVDINKMDPTRDLCLGWNVKEEPKSANVSIV
ncbi:CRE-ROD-1 protein [Caenorhabditis remanei]|uniref:CRE-ROD-1 protein n=1 Tax=Caenorhabditis remanei TaxID=31234 RepID=E3M359_CAERE|nr:CRE-ROD-1 protein [Caenorhabditis remanei]